MSEVVTPEAIESLTNPAENPQETPATETGKPDQPETKPQQPADNPADDPKPQAETPDPADQPITDFSKIKLEIEGADPALVASFGKQAVELGLSEKQVKALANWQYEAEMQRREAARAEGVKILAKEWGNDAAANQQEVLAMIASIDRTIAASNPALGQTAFSSALGRMGATCDVNIVRGLFIAAKALKEDGTAISNGAEMPERPQSAYDALKAIFPN